MTPRPNQFDDYPAELKRRSTTTRALVVIIAAVLFAGFCGLGYWQVERRAWKLDLIERVDARVHADPVSAPDKADWPKVTRARDEYLNVTMLGHYLNDRESQVYTATDYGAGYWVVTPFERVDGTIVMVNRGFVPTEKRDPSTREDAMIEGQTRVTGLLRMDEPEGTFIRANVPEEERWYSRDVRALAKKRGLDPANTAPYFIDADGDNNPYKLPIGGLTRIQFPNNHLSYALTWFAMAILTIVGAWIVLRPRRAKDESDEA
ncbi:SURF1 family protein [Thalassospira sp. MA62]|nr:SURF1 family protein [Thalassospira sp. MA62]